MNKRTPVDELIHRRKRLRNENILINKEVIII